MNLGFAPVVVPVLITLWPTRRTLGWARVLGALAIGALVVTVPVLGWLEAHHALGDAKIQVWDYARRWSAGDFAASPIRPFTVRDALTIPAGALWVLAIGSLVVAARVRTLRLAAVSAFAWIALMLIRVKINRSFEFNHHYYVALPGLVAGVMLGVHAITHAMPRQRIAVASLVLAVPIWAYTVSPQWTQLGLPVAARSPRFAVAYPMASFIKRHTRSSDPIFVAGSEAEVYWLSERRAPTRWFVNYVLYTHPQYARERARDLRRRPPAAIAAIAPETPADVAGDDVQKLIDREHYRLAFDIAGGRVWLRPDRVRPLDGPG
jgi:hypothetical protein